TWYHVAAVWDGSVQRLYINGSPDGTHAAPSVNYGTVTMPGRLLSYPNQNADGSIDEIRISNIARSPDWVLTEYRNQSAPASYLSVGPRLSGSIRRVRHSVKTDQ
ncbi:MAG TPA: LamG domain-containing protein, partial [Candidatus Solibacter sp.]